jgi:hypothetical protein
MGCEGWDGLNGVNRVNGRGYGYTRSGQIAFLEAKDWHFSDRLVGFYGYLFVFLLILQYLYI